VNPKLRSLFEAFLSRLDLFPRQDPDRRRPIDWLAHGFGVGADIVRRQPINTAIQREEEMLRRLRARRGR